MLIERHTRAAAYAANVDGPAVAAIAGYAPGLSGWWFWGL